MKPYSRIKYKLLVFCDDFVSIIHLLNNKKTERMKKETKRSHRYINIEARWSLEMTRFDPIIYAAMPVTNSTNVWKATCITPNTMQGNNCCSNNARTSMQKKSVLRSNKKPWSILMQKKKLFTYFLLEKRSHLASQRMQTARKSSDSFSFLLNLFNFNKIHFVNRSEDEGDREKWHKPHVFRINVLSTH